eukprot:UN29683
MRVGVKTIIRLLFLWQKISLFYIFLWVCIISFYVYEVLTALIDGDYDKFGEHIGLMIAGLCIAMYSLYATSIDQYKILASMLAQFGEKLEFLDVVTRELETTEKNLKETREKLGKTCVQLQTTSQKLGETEKSLGATSTSLQQSQLGLESQTYRLETLITEHSNLHEDNEKLLNEHEQLADKYKKLVEKYDITITEQQKILSRTLVAVGHLHEEGSDQINKLLQQVSKNVSSSKDAALEFGRNFYEVDKLKMSYV